MPISDCQMPNVERSETLGRRGPNVGQSESHWAAQHTLQDCGRQKEVKEQ
jgi:hypothetical protein